MTDKYYLDTSSIRLAGRRLLNLTVPRQCYTSAYTIIELLNGVQRDDQGYAKRGGGIKNLVTADVAIDWTMPDGRMASAFDALEYEEERIESLQYILACLVTSTSREDFIACESKLKLRYPVEYWEEYDETNGQGYIEATVAGNVDVRESFEREKKRSFSLLPDTIRQGSLAEFCRFFTEDLAQLNLAATVWAVATRMAKEMFERPSDDQIEQIAESYNSSLDVWVRAFSYVSMADQAEMRRPGRNDPLDLAHFLYLADDMVLVCEDKRMRDTAAAIGVRTETIINLLQSEETSEGTNIKRAA